MLTRRETVPMCVGGAYSDNIQDQVKNLLFHLGIPSQCITQINSIETVTFPRPARAWILGRQSECTGAGPPYPASRGGRQIAEPAKRVPGKPDRAEI